MSKSLRYRGILQVETSSNAVAKTLLSPVKKGARYTTENYGHFPMLISPLRSSLLLLPLLSKKALQVVGEVTDAQKRLKCEQDNKIVLLILDTQTKKHDKGDVWPHSRTGQSPVVLAGAFQITSVRKTFKEKESHLYYQAVAFELLLQKNPTAENLKHLQFQLNLLSRDEPVSDIFQIFNR